jgi:WD40 repeat protein
MDIYFDKKSSKNFILNCGYGLLKSYDYDKGKLFNNYAKSTDNKDFDTYFHFVINDNGTKTKLITAHSIGKIKIFNFNSAELLSEIKMDDSRRAFSSLCLWNNNYLFFANEKCSLKLIDIEKEKVKKSFPKESENGIFVKIFHHPLHGKCILSQHKNDTIKLWVQDN